MFRVSGSGVRGFWLDVWVRSSLLWYLTITFIKHVVIFDIFFLLFFFFFVVDSRIVSCLSRRLFIFIFICIFYLFSFFFSPANHRVIVLAEHLPTYLRTYIHTYTYIPNPTQSGTTAMYPNPRSPPCQKK